MTKTVKVQEAKTHLSALLAAVESGEDIVIARGDVPVARLVAIAAPGKRSLGGLDRHLGDDFFDDLPRKSSRRGRARACERAARHPCGDLGGRRA